MRLACCDKQRSMRRPRLPEHPPSESPHRARSAEHPPRLGSSRPSPRASQPAHPRSCSDHTTPATTPGSGCRAMRAAGARRDPLNSPEKIRQAILRIARSAGSRATLKNPRASRLRSFRGPTVARGASAGRAAVPDCSLAPPDIAGGSYPEGTTGVTGSARASLDMRCLFAAAAASSGPAAMPRQVSAATQLRPPLQIGLHPRHPVRYRRIARDSPARSSAMRLRLRPTALPRH